MTGFESSACDLQSMGSAEPDRQGANSELRAEITHAIAPSASETAPTSICAVAMSAALLDQMVAAPRPTRSDKQTVPKQRKPGKLVLAAQAPPYNHSHGGNAGKGSDSQQPVSHVQADLERGNRICGRYLDPSPIIRCDRFGIHRRPRPAVGQGEIRDRQPGVLMAHGGPQNELHEDKRGASKEPKPYAGVYSCAGAAITLAPHSPPPRTRKKRQ